MKSIVVATDGSAQAGRALTRAAELAKMSGAPLLIVQVQDARPLGRMPTHFAEVELSERLKRYMMPLVAHEGVVSMETNLQDAILMHDRQALALRQAISDQILEGAEAIVRKAGVAKVTTQSTIGDAATEIVAAAKAADADLIVMGRSGLSGVAELLLGSVSRKVLHMARCDVLTVV